MSLVCGGARPGLGVGRTICLDRQALQRGPRMGLIRGCRVLRRLCKQGWRLQRGLGMGLIRGCGVLRGHWGCGVLRGVWLQGRPGGKLRGWDRVRWPCRHGNIHMEGMGCMWDALVPLHRLKHIRALQKGLLLPRSMRTSLTTTATLRAAQAAVGSFQDVIPPRLQKVGSTPEPRQDCHSPASWGAAGGSHDRLRAEAWGWGEPCAWPRLPADSRRLILAATDTRASPWLGWAAGGSKAWPRSCPVGCPALPAWSWVSWPWPGMSAPGAEASGAFWACWAWLGLLGEPVSSPWLRWACWQAKAESLGGSCWAASRQASMLCWDASTGVPARTGASAGLLTCCVLGASSGAEEAAGASGAKGAGLGDGAGAGENLGRLSACLGMCREGFCTSATCARQGPHLQRAQGYQLKTSDVSCLQILDGLMPCSMCPAPGSSITIACPALLDSWQLYRAGVLDVLPGIISKHCAACHAASKDPLGQHFATGPGEAHLQRGLWGCSGAALYRLSRAWYCQSLGRLPRKLLLQLSVTRVGFRDAVEGLDGAELPEWGPPQGLLLTRGGGGAVPQETQRGLLVPEHLGCGQDPWKLASAFTRQEAAAWCADAQARQQSAQQAVCDLSYTCVSNASGPDLYTAVHMPRHTPASPKTCEQGCMPPDRSGPGGSLVSLVLEALQVGLGLGARLQGGRQLGLYGIWGPRTAQAAGGVPLHAWADVSRACQGVLRVCRGGGNGRQRLRERRWEHGVGTMAVGCRGVSRGRSAAGGGWGGLGGVWRVSLTAGGVLLQQGRGPPGGPGCEQKLLQCGTGGRLGAQRCCVGWPPAGGGWVGGILGAGGSRIGAGRQQKLPDQAGRALWAGASELRWGWQTPRPGLGHGSRAARYSSRSSGPPMYRCPVPRWAGTCKRAGVRGRECVGVWEGVRG